MLLATATVGKCSESRVVGETTVTVWWKRVCPRLPIAEVFKKQFFEEKGIKIYQTKRKSSAAIKSDVDENSNTGKAAFMKQGYGGMALGPEMCCMALTTCMIFRQQIQKISIFTHGPRKKKLLLTDHFYKAPSGTAGVHFVW